MPLVIAQAQATAPAAGWSDGPGVVRTILSLMVVLGLLAGCLWLIRRGGWQGGRKGPRAVQIETAVGLGDRRQLVIVSVEGRRLLLGVTPMHVGLVTELSAATATFADALATRVDATGDDAAARSGGGIR